MRLVIEASAMREAAMRLSALLKDEMTSVWCVLDQVIVHWLCIVYTLWHLELGVQFLVVLCAMWSS